MSVNDLNQSWKMPAAYLRLVIQHTVSENRSVDQLLENTGLMIDELFEDELTVSIEQTRQVLANATSAFGAGWHLTLARTLSISSHGPLGFAVVTAPDLQASINVLLRFIGIRTPFVWLTGTIEDDWFVMRLYEAIDMGAERTALIEVVMHSIQGLIERPLGREIQGARITFANPAPAYLDQLKSAFHTELEFNASGHTLSIPAAWLAEPCALFDQAMNRYLITRCEDESRVASGALPAEIAVRQALLTHTDGFPGLAEIAAMQHISPRTLIRRLKLGNTSYFAILKNVRKTLAVDYLLYSHMNIANIAYRLGYQDPSNFGRAFRGWFRLSPGRYRKISR